MENGWLLYVMLVFQQADFLYTGELTKTLKENHIYGLQFFQ